MPNVATHRGFHAPSERYFEYSDKAILKALDEGTILPDDAALLREFIGEISVNMSPARVYKHYYTLISWRTFIGPFRDNQAGDLFQGIENLKRHRKENGEGYSTHTMSDYIRFIKRFYLWLIENEYSTITEKKLKKIRLPKPDKMTVTTEELLTEEEVLKMIHACGNSRDRAIISMLWEGGFRIGEIGTLQWKQIKFNSWNAVVNTAEKTGNPRHIPLVMSRAYLAQWMNDYPFEPAGDNHVFLNLRSNEPIQYRGLQKKISKLANCAEIERKINPHLFRHSRITDLIRKNYNESVIKKMMWGNLTTSMFATYAHLSDSDIDQEIARHEGVVTEEQREDSPLEARQCPQCYTVNGPTARVCSVCGYALTEEARAERKEVVFGIGNLSKEELIKLIQEKW